MIQDSQETFAAITWVKNAFPAFIPYLKLIIKALKKQNLDYELVRESEVSTRLSLTIRLPKLRITKNAAPDIWHTIHDFFILIYLYPDTKRISKTYFARTTYTEIEEKAGYTHSHLRSGGLKTSWRTMCWGLNMQQNMSYAEEWDADNFTPVDFEPAIEYYFYNLIETLGQETDASISQNKPYFEIESIYGNASIKPSSNRYSLSGFLDRCTAKIDEIQDSEIESLDFVKINTSKNKIILNNNCLDSVKINTSKYKIILNNNFLLFAIKHRIINSTFIPFVLSETNKVITEDKSYFIEFKGQKYHYKVITEIKENYSPYALAVLNTTDYTNIADLNIGLDYTMLQFVKPYLESKKLELENKKIKN